MPFRTNFSGISGTLLVRTLQTYSRHPRWCKALPSESCHLGSAFGDVLRSTGDSSAAATLQLVALLRHPDGVDELAGGEIEQISTASPAQYPLRPPVHLLRNQL